MKWSVSIVLLLAPLGASAQTGSPTVEKVSRSVKFSPITKDITVVAWVNRDLVPEPNTTNVNIPLQIQLNNDPASCLLLLDAWASGERDSVSTEEERRYVNAILLRESNNSAPPRPSINPDSVASAGDYRLFNRAKVEFSLKDGKIFGAPRFVAVDLPIVGKTPEPCTFLAVRVDAQPHDDHGKRNKTPAETSVFQINEGRLGPDGLAVDRTINACNQQHCQGIPSGPTTPWIWNVIKFDLNGNFMQPLDSQMFPSYTIYVDKQFASEIPQSDAEAFISLDQTSQRVLSDIQ